MRKSSSCIYPSHSPLLNTETNLYRGLSIQRPTNVSHNKYMKLQSTLHFTKELGLEIWFCSKSSPPSLQRHLLDPNGESSPERRSGGGSNPSSLTCFTGRAKWTCGFILRARPSYSETSACVRWAHNGWLTAAITDNKSTRTVSLNHVTQGLGWTLGRIPWPWACVGHDVCAD